MQVCAPLSDTLQLKTAATPSHHYQTRYHFTPFIMNYCIFDIEMQVFQIIIDSSAAKQCSHKRFYIIGDMCSKVTIAKKSNRIHSDQVE